VRETTESVVISRDLAYARDIAGGESRERNERERKGENASATYYTSAIRQQVDLSRAVRLHRPEKNNEIHCVPGAIRRPLSFRCSRLPQIAARAVSSSTSSSDSYHGIPEGFILSTFSSNASRVRNRNRSRLAVSSLARSLAQKFPQETLIASRFARGHRCFHVAAT